MGTEPELGPEFETLFSASMMGIDAPIVVFRQLKKFMSVPGGRGVSGTAVEFEAAVPFIGIESAVLL
jgi:hypothetical protein